MEKFYRRWLRDVGGGFEVDLGEQGSRSIRMCQGGRRCMMWANRAERGTHLTECLKLCTIEHYSTVVVCISASLVNAPCTAG